MNGLNLKMEMRHRETARRLLILASLLLFLSQTGCQVFNRFRAQRSVPVVFQTAPDQYDLLQHLQAQSDRAQQIEADIKVSMDGMPSLRGTMVVERPYNLRLKAGLMGLTEMGVDVGSNEELFWVWSKVPTADNPSAIYYARHSEYQASSMRQAIPLEPSWIIDALGLVRFSPADQHAGPFPRSDGQLEIRSTIATPQGPTIRVCVVDPSHGYISQQAFYDKNHQLVAYLNSTCYQYESESGVSLPRHIELFVRQADGQTMKLVIDANSYRVNSIYGDRSRLWSMPNPGDVQMVDIAALASPATGGSAPQASPSELARPPGRSSSQSWYTDPSDPAARYIR
ncbi:MAG: hypothetical protein MK108_01170 [Mariniblastus sp.]|nr:hypothetical protein [Mariniblastus sp.]